VGWGVEVKIVQPKGVSILTSTPQPTTRQARRREGIPALTIVLRQANTPHTTTVSALRAPCVPVLTVTSGQSRLILSSVTR